MTVTAAHRNPQIVTTAVVEKLSTFAALYFDFTTSQWEIFMYTLHYIYLTARSRFADEDFNDELVSL